ncbi:flagellar hook-length control protein FliK [Aquipseudomonas alcaligenes]|uniref:Flagellar hook-length control protein FliK n=1 Tax=Aquipseudomonas alcaligenes TaxID=43263 RepID=A0AA37CGK7_AQUAC|nr:flagellar hook-length control protein FliK [Pseudomonas alcaligenes]BCR24835.1 flagellar hook-length control protein FliK [Pseudomonas alcaligenes]GIZ66051.1 flagellar hook-length control protein FliK [Pseudomonas alcaligenes]GIZ70356.1 flagellar hook-length control protein FliK [Pseudomonas alcaligenes]GIZ74709.1 flagellar hook-length control protein FliK [Pseudomonas alcaligenes]GIZ79065.1 flagellar hook-length control protein FliK [Pseudomonas alcaligenes]
MSVAPDFLLQSAPDVRPKAPAAKAPSTAPEPSRGEASSFAEVYAKERQAKAAERKEAGSKAAEERAAESKTTEEPAAEAAAEQQAVAESGNTLPEEVVDGGEEEVVDPLLLMAMTGQLPATEVVDPALSGAAEGEPLLQASAPTVASAAPATLTEASHDPELDMLNSLSGVKLALEIGAQNQAAAQQQLSPGAVAAERANNPAQGFANALAALAGDAMPSEEAPSEGLGGELLGEALDTSVPNLREGQSDARAEAFASKLSALSQAISQQINAAQRLPLVPGQPVQVGHPGMSEAVVDKVMWLSSQNLKSAEIQLDPAELGRLEVRIELNKDQAAQVTFVSANANVRDQLEGQAHRLRELFAQQGMNQLDVNVSDQSMARGSQGGGEEGQRRSAGRGFGGSRDEEAIGGVSEIRTPSSGAAPRGLVDYYA